MYLIQIRFDKKRSLLITGIRQHKWC